MALGHSDVDWMAVKDMPIEEREARAAYSSWLRETEIERMSAHGAWDAWRDECRQLEKDAVKGRALVEVGSYWVELEGGARVDFSDESGDTYDVPGLVYPPAPPPGPSYAGWQPGMIDLSDITQALVPDAAPLTAMLTKMRGRQ